MFNPDPNLAKLRQAIKALPPEVFIDPADALEIMAVSLGFTAQELNEALDAAAAAFAELWATMQRCDDE